jgi:hypothetical protein
MEIRAVRVRGWDIRTGRRIADTVTGCLWRHVIVLSLEELIYDCPFLLITIECPLLDCLLRLLCCLEKLVAGVFWLTLDLQEWPRLRKQLDASCAARDRW